MNRILRGQNPKTLQDMAESIYNGAHAWGQHFDPPMLGRQQLFQVVCYLYEEADLNRGAKELEEAQLGTQWEEERKAMKEELTKARRQYAAANARNAKLQKEIDKLAEAIGRQA